jgi:putative ABC transport system ATP-binding protein
MSAGGPLLEVVEVERSFGPTHRTRALRGVSLRLRSGERLAVVGPSGSGKSTLLQILGLLDRPDGGRVLVGGTEAWSLTARKRAHLRLTHFGFVFQRHHLFAALSARDNVALPGWRASGDRRRSLMRADALLEEVGLADRRRERAGVLSVGEAQRVAVARALINDPAILLADEPTGALDSASAAQVLDLFLRFCDGSRALVLVTHDAEIASRAHRRIVLRDGRIAEETALA